MIVLAIAGGVLAGVVGTLFLILYAVMLGTDGALYAKLRRYGMQ